MKGRGIQTLIETLLVIVHEIAIWIQNRPNPKRDKDHVPKG